MADIIEVAASSIEDGVYTPNGKQWVRQKPSRKGKQLYMLGAGKHVPVYEVKTLWPSGDTWLRISEDRWTAFMIEDAILGLGEWIYGTV